MRIALLILTVAILLAVLWAAGEQHRQNCILDGRQSCSILPWDDGKRAASDWGDGPGWGDVEGW